MFPHRGFTTWKHRCVDIWSGYVSGYWMCSSSVGIPVVSNMVSEIVWRPALVVDRDREAELPHLHFFVIFVQSWAKGTIPLHPKHSFHSGTLFVSLEKVFVFPRYDHYSQIWRYKVWIRIFKIFCTEVFWFYSVLYFFISGLLLF